MKKTNIGWGIDLDCYNESCTIPCLGVAILIRKVDFYVKIIYNYL